LQSFGEALRHSVHNSGSLKLHMSGIGDISPPVESIFSRNYCLDFAAMITVATKGLAKSRVTGIKLRRIITAALSLQ
jgi:hypothetical protein